MAVTAPGPGGGAAAHPRGRPRRCHRRWHRRRQDRSGLLADLVPVNQEDERGIAEAGCRVLYLAPLKALINDQFDRLERMTEGMEIPGCAGTATRANQRTRLRRAPRRYPADHTGVPGGDPGDTRDPGPEDLRGAALCGDRRAARLHRQRARQAAPIPSTPGRTGHRAARPAHRVERHPGGHGHGRVLPAAGWRSGPLHRGNRRRQDILLQCEATARCPRPPSPRQGRRRPEG